MPDFLSYLEQLHAPGRTHKSLKMSKQMNIAAFT